MINWIDLVIVLVVLLYILQGWQDGVVRLAGSLVSFLGALWLAIKLHQPVGAWIGEKFGIPAAWTNVFGYLAVAVITEVVLVEIVNVLAGKVPKRWLGSRWDKGLGAVLSAMNALVLIAFLLLVILALPLRGTIKKDIESSLLASGLVSAADKYGGAVKSSLDSATRQAVRFLTIRPQSGDTLALDFLPEECQLITDRATERQMLELVNQERAKEEAGQLVWDERVAIVSRAHATDMFERKYFAHVSPEGKDAGDRLDEAGISYLAAGENLAFAPDLMTAHEGLMNSEGHRRNIMDPGFGTGGIGVINGGNCGMMFVQVFTD